MTTAQTHRQIAPDASLAGLLRSLSHSLPNPSGPLGRRARRLAGAISEGASTRAQANTAATLLARLLDAADVSAECWPEDGLLDAEFDA